MVLATRPLTTILYSNLYALGHLKCFYPCEEESLRVCTRLCFSQCVVLEWVN